MELKLLSVARRRAIIYQMCWCLATAPLGTPPPGFPTTGPPHQGSDSPQCCCLCEGRRQSLMMGGGAEDEPLGRPQSQKERVPLLKREASGAPAAPHSPCCPIPLEAGPSLCPGGRGAVSQSGCVGLCWVLCSGLTLCLPSSLLKRPRTSPHQSIALVHTTEPALGEPGWGDHAPRQGLQGSSGRLAGGVGSPRGHPPGSS